MLHYGLKGRGLHAPPALGIVATTGITRRLFSTAKGGSTGEKKKLVILGCGWGGFRTLLDVDITKYDVNVISPRNHFLFTPLLTSTTVGTLEFRGVTEQVRTARPKLNYVQAHCTGVDVENNLVHLEDYYDHRDYDEQVPYRPHFTMRYDELVIAVGGRPNTFNVPGVEKYCFFLKEIHDARKIRNRIIECFERASNPVTPEEEKKRLLHFMIIGGGPTSVEFTAELHDFMIQNVVKYFPGLKEKVEITLVEAGKKLLSSFDAKLSEYTMKTFQKRKVDVRTGVSVKEVRRHEIELSDGSILPFGLAVWSTGLKGSPFVEALPFKKTRDSRILTDDHCRVKDPQLSNVYAIGDCAAFETSPLPQTAQNAEQEGKYLARQLNAKAQGKPLTAFVQVHKGMLAYIGGHRALVDTPIVKNSGFLSWLIWNAAYITKLVSLKNKIMIPIYWTISAIFGRDISRF